MTEHISMNGAPVVGFGDANISISNPLIYTPFIGYVVGAAGGGVLGSLVSKKSRVSTGVGTALGGFVGMAVGGQIAMWRVRKQAEEDQTNE
jgi:hypothetical protein